MEERREGGKIGRKEGETSLDERECTCRRRVILTKLYPLCLGSYLSKNMNLMCSTERMAFRHGRNSWRSKLPGYRRGEGGRE